MRPSLWNANSESSQPRRARRRLYGTWFVLHFSFLAAVCGRETIDVLRVGPTILPYSVANILTGIDSRSRPAAASSGQRMRSVVAAYSHAAGINSGYGFFAPNVPDSLEVSFELGYPDNRIETVTLADDIGQRDLRVATMLDYVGGTESDRARSLMVKMLAEWVGRKHPGAKSIGVTINRVANASGAESGVSRTVMREQPYHYNFAFSADQELHRETEEP